MPYSYLEHTADMGIRAEGSDLAEAFESGAEAVLELFFELDTISVENSVSFGVWSTEPTLLFVEFLNEIISIQDSRGLAFKSVRVLDIKPSEEGLLLTATAYGEPIDLGKHKVKTEVKAATYSGLSYKHFGGRDVLECILDV